MINARLGSRAGAVPDDYPGKVAMDYPDCYNLLEEKVMPERTRKNTDGQFILRYPLYLKWWIYAEKRPALYSTIEVLERVLVVARTAKYRCYFFVDPDQVLDMNLVIFPFSHVQCFALLQATLHEVWVNEQSSTLETRQGYRPSDCFETFPFPAESAMTKLTDIGERYYTYRQYIMQARQEGLTKTYNRFHEPDEKSPDIQKLRELHVEMDQAVAVAYGWNDLDLEHGFHQTKQGLRFTISEPARRDVLARLLALNHARHAEELAAAQAAALATGATKPKKRTGRKTATPVDSQPLLL